MVFLIRQDYNTPVDTDQLSARSSVVCPGQVADVRKLTMKPGCGEKSRGSIPRDASPDDFHQRAMLRQEIDNVQLLDLAPRFVWSTTSSGMANGTEAGRQSVHIPVGPSFSSN